MTVEYIAIWGQGNRNKDKTVDFYEIKPRLTKNGYARVYARQTSTNKRKDLYIHRLVAQYFLPNPQDKKYVNHKNCIRIKIALGMTIELKI